MAPNLYMIIDTTTLEATKVLLVAGVREAGFHGRLLKAQGKNVIAPPIEGRGFSKLSPLALSYLCWNTFGTTPPEDYSELLAVCLEGARAMETDPTGVETLTKLCEKLCPTNDAAAPDLEGVKVKVKKAAPKSAKGLATVTDLIRDECEKQATSGKDMVAIREAVKNWGEGEGLNKATVATQFSRWKRSKVAS